MKKTSTLLLLFLFSMIFSYKISAQTTTINGLTVVVNYSDVSMNTTLDSISMMMNQESGFTAWGNNGSVKEYFTTQTSGKVALNSHVISVTLAQNFRYYHGPSLPYNGGIELVKDVVAAINAAYPSGFTNLTYHPTEGRLWHFSILSSSNANGLGVAYGFNEGLTVLNNGVPIPVKNVGVAGFVLPAKPEINVICHEFGHSVFGWTDYYNTEHGGASNMGHYCLMGSGGRRGYPMHITAALRYKKGWISNVVELNASATQTYQAVANTPNHVFKYTNENNPKEYYLIEAYTHSKYYLSYTGDRFPNNQHYVPDQGLAIWYVDEDGGLLNPPSNPNLKISLVQADGFDQMRGRNSTHYQMRGDSTDLFNERFPIFNDSIYHRFRWKSGEETGLIITDISPASDTMTFTLNARENTISTLSNPYGRVIPGGLVNAKTGQDKTFKLVPDIGYEIDKLYVNGLLQPIDSQYTFTNVTTSHSLDIEFKKGGPSVDALPSPWQNTVIGGPSKIGAGGYRNGTFGIETYGGDIYNQSDQFNFINHPLNGNGEIVAHISYFNNARDWSKAGVMIRETLNANSKYVMVVKTPWNGIAPQNRPSTGGYSYHNLGGSSRIDTLRSANWVKITRVGSEIKSYYSHNGTSWTFLETTIVSMSSNVYVGLCASGSNGTIPVKVNFDHVSVNSYNLPPSVGISAPANLATYTAPASVSITAAALDIDGSISKVEFYQGSNLLGTAYTSPYTYNWTGVTAGTYSLTAKAFDNLGATATSSPVSITVNAGAACTAPIWNASTVYTEGQEAQYDGIRYRANWWIVGQRPDLNNGPLGTGKPWTSLGTCTSRKGLAEESLVQNQIAVSPNPVGDASTVLVTLSEDQESVSVYLTDMFGRIVLNLHKGSLEKGSHSFELDARTLSQGLYILCFRGADISQNVSIVK
jgi:M6 family metalloprotease-like protein